MPTDVDKKFRFPSLAEWGSFDDKRPFYLSRRQCALLRMVYRFWGEEAVVQIYGGCIRVRTESGDWRFASPVELRRALAERGNVRSGGAGKKPPLRE